MNLKSKTIRSRELLKSPRRDHPSLPGNPRENELRLISDLSVAREVQQRLFEREVQDVPGVDLAAGCVPARELGGDFYDFLPHGGGRLGLALGDVSGKGTAAALLGALAMGIFHAHTVDCTGSPPEVLAALNDRIHAVGLDGRFVVMLFAVLDRGAQQLALANAGNPYPLLLRGGGVEEIPVSGIPLGLMEGTRYDAVSLDLRLGDVVVFASDGILECQNREQEAFGTGRLVELLTSIPKDAPAKDVSSAILEATDEFSHDAPVQNDDRSLIVLRVTDRLDLSRLPVIY